MLNEAKYDIDFRNWKNGFATCYFLFSTLNFHLLSNDYTFGDTKQRKSLFYLKVTFLIYLTI